MKHLSIIHPCIFMLILCLLSSCEKQEEKLPTRTIEGYVYNRITKEPIEGATVTLKEVYFGNVFRFSDYTPIKYTKETDENGFYQFTFRDDLEFELRVSKYEEGYFHDEISLYNQIENDERYIYKDVYLAPKAWVKVHIKNQSPFDASDLLYYYNKDRYISGSSSSRLGMYSSTLPDLYHGSDVDIEKIETIQADTIQSRRWRSVKNGVVVEQEETFFCEQNDTCLLTIYY